jgi:hypothetical protein
VAAPVASACSAVAAALATLLPDSKSLLVFAPVVFALTCDAMGAGAVGAIALLCNPPEAEFVAGAAVPKVEAARPATLAAGRIIFGKVDAAASVPGPGLEK